MERKVLIFLCVLGLSWCCDAREMVTIYRNIGIISVFRTNTHQSGRDAQIAEVGKDEVCSSCEQFVSDAVNYISNNETQTEITEMLHHSCSKLLSFKQECIDLVDYYAPLFFLEVSLIQPGDFCQNINLCETVVRLSERLSKDSCNECHQAVNEAVVKLKDPEAQLEVLEILLKACDATENYAKKCKNLVFEYAPLILANAEQFLEKNDICTMLHACNPAAIDNDQSSSTSAEIALHSAY